MYKYTKNKKPFVILKFKCTFPKFSATYLFTLNNDYINNKSTLNFTVVQTCPILHRKGVDCPRFINKNKRSQIGKLLVKDNLSPVALFYELMPGSEIPEDMLDKEDDIRKFVPSKSVLRKIKCETLKKQKLDQDPFLDLIKFKALQESEKNYFIKEVSYSPLRIFLFYDRMLKIIKLEIKIKKCLDIHLDCTGSLFKKYSEKRAFYYSIALPSVKGNSSLTLCPQISIYDGILSDHTTFSIAHRLNYFVKILEQNTGKTHPVRKVEVDFSWAFLHASVEAFNKTDLKTYLQRSFEVTTKSKLMSDFSFFTVVHICAAHLIKSVCTNVSKFSKPKIIKNKFMFCFARLLNSYDLDSARDFLYNIIVIFMSEFETDLFKNSLKVIDINIQNPDYDLSLQTDINSDINNNDKFNNFNTNFQEGLINGSPYYLYFNKVFIEAETAIGSAPKGIKSNCLFCPDIIKSTFLKKYLALFPLWSGVHLVHMHKTRDTNSTVENWFRQTKKTFNYKRYRYSEFIHKLHSVLGPRVNERLVCLNKVETTNKIKHTRKLENISSNVVQEQWSRKRSHEQGVKNKKSKYFSTPKVKSGTDNFYPLVSKTPLTFQTLHNDHNYFKNSKNMRHFYNLNIIYEQTMNKRDIDLINTFKNCSLTGKGVKKLKGSAWLDDEVINSYFQLVCDSSSSKIFFVDSLNYQTFKKYQELNLPYSLKKSLVSFKDLDYVYFVINFTKSEHDAHWAFSVVDVKNKTISFYDSIKNLSRDYYNGHCVCLDVKKFMRSTNFIRDIPACDWKLEYPETPQQTDGNSCGVFCCQLAKQLSRNQLLKLETKDIPFLRKEMTCELSLGVLFM